MAGQQRRLLLLWLAGDWLWLAGRFSIAGWFWLAGWLAGMLDWSARMKEVCIKPGVFDTDIKVSSEAMQEQSPEGEGGGGGSHGVPGAR